ncbi:MAG: MATE family efflux transporter [Lachnospirales bacterium]
MKKIDLTEGSILKLLLSVAIPSILAGLMQFTYNIVDMLVLGRVLGKNALAGVGTASIFINYGVSLIFLVVTGAGVKIAHSIGSNNKEDYNLYLNSGYFLYGIITIISFVFFTIFPSFTLSIMKINEAETYTAAITYLRIYGFVNIFAFLNTIYTRVLTNLGLTKIYMKVNTIGVITNLVLDVLFVYFLGFGVSGAVVATLIAQGLMTFIFLYKHFENLAYKVNTPLNHMYTKDIFSLGIPYTLQRLFFTFISMLVATALFKFGDEVVAAQKLGLQIESATLLVSAGLLSATSAFVGQNFGAKNYDRIHKAFKISLTIGECYAFLTSIIFFFFAENIAKLFIADTMTVTYTAMYLKFIALGQFFSVLEMIGNGMYSGIGKPQIPAYISLIITPLRLIFALYLTNYFGPEVVFLGILVTTILKGVISYGYYLFFVKKQIGVTIVPKR